TSSLRGYSEVEPVLCRALDLDDPVIAVARTPRSVHALIREARREIALPGVGDPLAAFILGDGPVPRLGAHDRHDRISRVAHPARGLLADFDAVAPGDRPLARRQ